MSKKNRTRIYAVPIAIGIADKKTDFNPDASG